MLWHYAPEMTHKETQVRDWNEQYWALMPRKSEIAFTFRQLTIALAHAWELPSLIVMLIKGTDTPRANIARLATDAAKIVMTDPQIPALLAVLAEIAPVVPGASPEELIDPLALNYELRAALLAARLEQVQAPT